MNKKIRKNRLFKLNENDKSYDNPDKNKNKQ